LQIIRKGTTGFTEDNLNPAFYLNYISKVKVSNSDTNLTILFSEIIFIVRIIRKIQVHSSGEKHAVLMCVNGTVILLLDLH